MKTLKVLLTDKDIGEVTQRANGSYRFEYLPEWQRNPRHIPISRSMPLQQQRHGVRPITNFMWGLLPDNERILDAWAKRFQVSARNPFALLAAVFGGGEELSTVPFAYGVAAIGADAQKRIDTLAGVWVLVCYSAAGFLPRFDAGFWF